MTNIVYQPSFISPYQHPYASLDEARAHSQRVGKRMDEIFEHLSSLTIPEDNRKKRKWKPLCNNNPCNLVTYIFNNCFRIVKDAIGDYFCCRSCGISNENPKKIPLPKEFSDITTQSTKDFHTNLFGLGVIAPSMVLLAALLDSTPLMIISGLSTLYYAGARTYVFSGDFGVQNFDGNLTLGSGIRLAATNDLQEGHRLLATHLKKKWDGANLQERKIIYERCLRISDKQNWNHLMIELNEAGIHKDFVQSILTPLSECILEIRKEFELNINYDQIDSSPETSPLINSISYS